MARQIIPANGAETITSKSKAGVLMEQGQYVVDQTKQITYVYERKDTHGSVVVRHQDVNTHALLTHEQTVGSW